MVTISNNYWTFNGDLTKDNVQKIFKDCSKHLTTIVDTWNIDFIKCNKIDISGIALIIEYIKYSTKNKINLELHNINANTLLLAKVHGAAYILNKFIK